MLSQNLSKYSTDQENDPGTNGTPLKPNLAAKTPITERRSLREITNSTSRDSNGTSTLFPTMTKRALAPSKLSNVINTDDIPEPEFAPILPGTIEFLLLYIKRLKRTKMLRLTMTCQASFDQNASLT